MAGTASGYDTRPDYRVDLLARRNRMTARAGETVLADSSSCLLVDEQDHGLVVYFPRDATRLDLLTPTDDESVCSFKGRASYWRLADGSEQRPVAWSYEQPHPQVARLAGMIAFYQDRVEVRIGEAHPAVSGR